MEKYDCTQDTKDHISNVRFLIEILIGELRVRGEYHDYTKLSDNCKPLFDEFTPKLKHCAYGSAEYKDFLKELKPALDYHYAMEGHHPEHYSNGVKGMNLIDLIEMICDWKASCERHEKGDIRKSIKINQERFGYSDELANILNNTIDLLDEYK